MIDVRVEDLMRDLNRVRRVVRRRLRARMPQGPLPPAQVEVLQVVEEQPGCGISAAARAMHMADNSVSGLVNQLVGAGLLRRETDKADRRMAHLYLTPAAVERLATWRSARAEMVGTGLSRLPADDREAISRAVPALRRLADLLSEEEDA
jgi:DNA-binding MarR family transcriptional regulator